MGEETEPQPPFEVRHVTGLPDEDFYAVTDAAGNELALSSLIRHADFVAHRCNTHDDLLAACRLALKFINNGIEFGYIKMPDKGDSALLTPEFLRAAIAKAEGGEGRGLGTGTLRGHQGASRGVEGGAGCGVVQLPALPLTKTEEVWNS